MNQPPVYFFIPPHLWPTPFPDENDFEWEGYKDGIYCWTLQTYFRLKQADIQCQLVSELPEEGIILAHRGCLDDKFIPNKNQLLVCMQADWGMHPYAQVHIVQNPYQVEKQHIPKLDRLFFPGVRYFVKHWPQPGLSGRDASRGFQFRHIAYFGRTLNLAPELKSDNWANYLQTKGIKWSIFEDPERWKDYSDVDATISIRSFTATEFYFKPATKLYNSWNAGVIPICGPESAFIAENKNPYDCIIVNSLEELKQKIDVLVSDKAETKKYFLGSKNRANDISVKSIVAEWDLLIQNSLIPEYNLWRGRTGLYRLFFYSVRWLGFRVKTSKEKLLPEN